MASEGDGCHAVRTSTLPPHEHGSGVGAEGSVPGSDQRVEEGSRHRAELPCGPHRVAQTPGHVELAQLTACRGRHSMFSHWSMLFFLLLPLAGATISFEARALPGEPPASGLHTSSTDKARQYFTADDIARGRAYAGGRRLLYFLRLALTLALFGVLSLPTVSSRLRDISVSIAGGRVWLTIAVFGLIVGLLYFVVTFPLNLYGNFLREHTFGLSTQGFASWAWDHTKAALIGTGIMLPLLVLLYSLIRWN